MRLNETEIDIHRQNLLANRDPASALALYRHSVALDRAGIACERFLVCRALGVEFEEADLEYQAKAWATLSESSKSRVRKAVDQYLRPFTPGK